MSKTFAFNKRAGFDYDLLEKFEAGLVLFGHEVKSVKLGHSSLKSSFVTAHNGELFLINCHIPAYKFSGPMPDYNPDRSRKILLNKKEINYLIGKTQEKGLTLTAVRLYNKGNRIKLEFAVARGKKNYDKRATIKERETDREMARELKNNF
ncbi:MAG: SsrA-binding protein SmpB [bacterium]